MDEWQHYFQFAQSVFIGVIFSYLLAKLISLVVSFREENLSIVRGDDSVGEDESNPLSSDSEQTDRDLGGLDAESSNSRARVSVGEPLVPANEGGGMSGEVDEGMDDSDGDWEGVESTELDEAFSAATAFVAARAADMSQNVSNEMQLQLYGLYKIATEGPCTAPQPSPFKMAARAKWQAWKKLGAVPTEEAMQKYIAMVTELFPTWAAGSSSKAKGQGSTAPSGDTGGPVGPVFSSFIYEEESGNELKLDAIHAFAREGEEENLLKCIDSGIPVDLKDSEGRTPLHWAVDRGHLKTVELLVSKGADVNAKDDEGQSPLHYAAVCEREAIGEFLVKENADTELKDNDGNSPFDLCDMRWPWLQNTVA